MENLLHLMRDRAIALDKMEQILHTAQKANRDLTKSERDEFDDQMREADLLEAKIKAHPCGGGADTAPATSGAGQLFGAVRQYQSSGAFPDLGSQLQAVMQASAPGARADDRLYETRASGLNEAIGSEGGFGIQTDFANQILDRVYEAAQLAPRCNRIPISSNSNGITIPACDETSRADGSRWGGVRGYWVAEAGALTSSKPKYRAMNLTLKKVAALTYITEELAADAAALEAHVRRVVPLELGFKLQDAIVNGDGAGKPLGILQSGCLIQVPKETGQAAGSIVYENVCNMWARFNGNYERAVFLAHRSALPQIYQLKIEVGTGGSAAYLPAGGASGRPYDTVFGRPLLVIEQCAAVGTVGDLILADLGEYTLIEKGGIQATSSIHVQFTTDERVLKFVYRVDGQPNYSSPLTPFKGTDSESPFVAIATRA